ncbi:PQ loop repeat-domain-containing protein [Cokeromyces recurvatus]|uniref:PQ loop repeat-domain-containing protein n=1 Tax=Cokeromyces recurvatus TaxID=90255 RepID=UPI00221F8BE1|nr:PQ loop repeat-domain-containing protein [Cokeromyces recurvatus]KAI7899875.1 PQ loop repeat-domain-containing protein [Cokeromyces recurvatus]
MTICLPTEDGIPYNKWINIIFGDCVYGTQDALSLLLGYISIFFWLNAQLPQVIQNYKSGSADCLSLNFLSIWLAGDTFNLLGAILTHQLPFQLYLGIYFVSIDLCLLFQWIYYNKLKPSSSTATKDDYLIIPSTAIDINTEDTLFQHPALQHTPLNISHTNVLDELTPFSSSASPSKWYTLSSSKDEQPIIVTSIKHHKQHRFMAILLFGTLFNIQQEDSIIMNSISQDRLLWLGRILAWSCTSLYLMSRIPQLLKNRRRQSVEGLSASLFIFAVCGNLTYATSILTHPGQTLDSLLESLPYLIGSAGTLIFDFSIFCQFLWYKKRTTIDNKLATIEGIA